MCFSASVSFLTSGALAVAGVDALSHAKRKERFIAVVPVIFAIQQFIEGLQWLVEKPSLSSTMLGYGFLFFAFLLWPTYVPLSLFLMEIQQGRRKWIRVFLIFGVLLTIYLAIMLVKQPLAVFEANRHLIYDTVAPFPGFGVVYYLFVVTGSFLCSPNNYFRWFGVLAFFSALATLFIAQVAFVSVWCFFAAALSILIWYYVRFKSSVKKTKVKKNFTFDPIGSKT